MRRLRVTVIGILVVVAGLALQTAPAQAIQTVPHDRLVSENPANYTPHALDGEVDSIARVGDLIVMGGSFTQVQAASGGPVLDRHSIFAFDEDSGAISAFAPDLTGIVKTVVKGPGSTVYVGGTFNSANGARAYKVVQLDVPSGTVVDTFRPGRVDAIVRSIRYVGGRLFIGGEFTSVGGQQRMRLAELDPVTGDVLSLDIPVEGVHWGGKTQIYQMDVDPAARKLVVVGNFTSVSGQSRTEVAMVDLTTNSLSSWATNRYMPRCYDVFNFIVRDVEFSPDGEYFAIGGTGGYGSGSPSLCDSVTRWESDRTGPGQNPTWIDYTGGDSVYSVAITGSAIYTGGHMRWFNNPSRADAVGPGAMERTGIAALDPINGLPFSWNPTRARGQGVFDMLATEDGLYIGSDTDTVAWEYHGKLAFFPLSAGGQIPHPQPPSLPVDVYALGDTSNSTTNVLYRVNAGGPAVPALDNGPDWSDDTGALSSLRNSGSNAASWSPVPAVDGTVPATTPRAIFDSERWDPGDATEMSWALPVTSGTNVTVRLYLANRCGCTSTVGSRQFDVSIEGNIVLDNFDPTAAAGDQTGTMRAFDVTSDGVINVNFGHVVENPLINGIEVIDRSASPPPPGGLASREFDGTTVGAQSALDPQGVDWSNARGAFMADGTLYSAWLDGRLLKRSFNGSTFGPASEVDLHGLGQFASEMQRMTGLFYEDGRIYYTLSGSNQLYMRYFTVESDTVGAGLKDLAPFTVSSSTLEMPWGSVRGMFLASGKLYWAERTTGILHRIDWSNGSPVPGTGAVVSGPAVDGNRWSQYALMARAGVPNAFPTAAFTHSCDELACSFADTSQDSDGSIASRSWDFGDGSRSTAANPDHTYAASGSYQVSLTVADDRGGSDTETRTIQVTTTPNAAPQADFTASCGGLACSFTDASSDSDGSIVVRSWAFGDGGSSTATNPEHTYASAGSYQVSLTVTDDDGVTGTHTIQVDVAELASDVSFVASDVDDDTTTSRNHRITVPAAAQPGDTLLLVFSSNGPSVPTSGPSGWEQVGNESTSRMLTRYWTETATSDSAGSQVTVTTDSWVRGLLSVHVYRGAQAPVASDVTTAGESVDRAAHTTPSGSVTVPGSWVVSVWADKTADTTTWAAPAGQQVRVNRAGSGAGHVSQLVTDGGGPEPTGATGGLTATADSSSRQATMATIVLRPTG